MPNNKWDDYHKKNEELVALNRLIFNLERLQHWQAEEASEKRDKAIALHEKKRDERLEKYPVWQNKSIEELKQSLAPLQEQTRQTIVADDNKTIKSMVETYQKEFESKPGYGKAEVKGNSIAFNLNSKNFDVLVRKYAEQGMKFKAIDNKQNPPVEYRAEEGRLRKRVGDGEWEEVKKNPTQDMRERVQDRRQEDEQQVEEEHHDVDRNRGFPPVHR